MTDDRKPRLDRHLRRKGTLVIAVLVALAIISMIMLESIPRSLRERHEAKFHERIVQARYLCDAGIDGAIARWKNNPAYKGGEISVELTEQSGLGGHIAIDVSSDRTGALLTVRAEVRNLSAPPTKSIYDHPVICERTLKLGNHPQE